MSVYICSLPGWYIQIVVELIVIMLLCSVFASLLLAVCWISREIPIVRIMRVIRFLFQMAIITIVRGIYTYKHIQRWACWTFATKSVASEMLHFQRHFTTIRFILPVSQFRLHNENNSFEQLYVLYIDWKSRHKSKKRQFSFEKHTHTHNLNTHTPLKWTIIEQDKRCHKKRSAMCARNIQYNSLHALNMF